eukprot:m.820826 g.820826  ORF g.820826 m.820826 type:complete len:258 (+) comp59395_c0_seq46:6164-6937(+)
MELPRLIAPTDLSRDQWELIPTLLEAISGLVDLTNRVQHRDFLVCDVAPEARVKKFWTSPASLGVKAAVFHNRYKQLRFLSEPERLATHASLAAEFKTEFPEAPAATTVPVSLDPYCAIPKDNEQLSVLDYWSQYFVKFPLVFQLARRYLSMLPSSAEAERAFSVAKFLHQDRRCAMTDRRFAELCFVKFNEPTLVRLRENRRRLRAERETGRLGSEKAASASVQKRKAASMEESEEVRQQKCGTSSGTLMLLDFTG